VNPFVFIRRSGRWNALSRSEASLSASFFEPVLIRGFPATIDSRISHSFIFPFSAIKLPECLALKDSLDFSYGS
jgi:hypothetical protein